MKAPSGSADRGAGGGFEVLRDPYVLALAHQPDLPVQVELYLLYVVLPAIGADGQCERGQCVRVRVAAQRRHAEVAEGDDPVVPFCIEAKFRFSTASVWVRDWERMTFSDILYIDTSRVRFSIWAT